MRILFPALSLLIAGPALAADLTAPLNVTAATVYSQGANLTYNTTLDLPAGNHRILLPYDLGGYSFTPPQLKVTEGVSIGAINYLTDVVYDQDALLSPEQTSAKAAVETAKEAITAQQTQIRTVALQLEALDTQMGFLKSISGGELTTADPAQMRALAQMVRDEAEAGIARRLELEQQSRDLSKELSELTATLHEAERQFSSLSPPAGQGGMMAISVEVVAPVSASFEVARIANDARWSVDYDFRLDYGDDPKLSVERKVVVEQATGQAWSDIDLVLSTANPFSQSTPSNAGYNLARIYKPELVGKLPSPVRMSAASDGMVEEVVYVEEPVIVATSQFDGLSLSYVYPRKVSIDTDETAQLVLDSFTLPVETSLLAVPRRDETAFVMAAITNNTGEPLLPGMASYYRDGAFIGREEFELIPAGTEADLPFGAMEGIRLTYTALRQETGDSGIITTSKTREDVVEFSVENLTGESQDIRTLYALPYSQQEDLVVSTTIRPNPSETNVDDVRGLSEWNMTILSGETQKVRLSTTLSWPKDFELNWSQ